MNEGVAYQDKASPGVLATLQQAQLAHGYLPRDYLVELAESLGLPVNDIYAVATFYSFLSVKPVGRHVIRVCRSLPCFLRDSRVIVETLAGEFGLRPGETTGDGRFSFELTNCIGLCDRAPAMLVDGDPHVELTPRKITEILKKYK